MNRLLPVAAAMTLLAVAGCAARPTTPLNESFFKATHNSYSGGPRGSIVAQLDAAVRFLELDLHDDDFTSHNDFRIGHDQPVDEVDLTPLNPPVVFLRAWLQAINTWSDAHPKHAPITLCLDLKDDISGNSAGAGDLHFLNQQLRQVFGGKLYTSAGHRGQWPATESIRGRVIIILTGSLATRQAYLRRTDPSWYEQIAFVEFQKGDDDALTSPRFEFFAAQYTPANLDWAAAWRERGKLVRLWRFNDPLPAHVGAPPANYPATDRPFADWYVDYARTLPTTD